MGKINSKTKGKVGELEVVNLLKKHGREARRGQQFSGGDDSPDVVSDIDWLHIEVKRTEKLRLYDALRQSADDCAHSDRMPSVWHRSNNNEWVVIMKADDFMKLVDAYDAEYEGEQFDFLR